MVKVEISWFRYSKGAQRSLWRSFFEWREAWQGQLSLHWRMAVWRGLSIWNKIGVGNFIFANQNNGLSRSISRRRSSRRGIRFGRQWSRSKEKISSWCRVISELIYDLKWHILWWSSIEQRLSRCCKMTIDRYLPKHMKNKLGISSLVILFGGASRRWEDMIVLFWIKCVFTS